MVRLRKWIGPSFEHFSKGQKGIFLNQLTLFYASLALSILYLLVFILYFNHASGIQVYYLITTVFMALLTGLLFFILHKSILKPWAKIVVLMTPFVMMSFALGSFFIGVDYFTEHMIFMIIVLLLAFIVINGAHYTTSLFGYAFFAFLILSLLKHGLNFTLLMPWLLLIIFCALINLGLHVFLHRLWVAKQQSTFFKHKENDTMQKLKQVNYELEQTQNIAEMMMEITSDVITSDDLESLLSVIIKRAVEVIPNAIAGTILLKEENQMRFIAAYGYDKDKLNQIKIYFKDTFQYKTGNLKTPVIIQDSEAFNRLNTSTEFTQQFIDLDIPSSKSVISSPIIVDDEIYGSINLDNFNYEMAFKESDKPIIQYLAEQIALALNNQMLLQKALYYTKHDMLTDAYTRIHHEKLLNEVFEQAKESQKPFCIAIIDINYMKYINDTFGHQAGDEVLKTFSKHTQKILDDHHYLARFGGDEFSILFENTEFKAAEKIIGKLREHFKAHPLYFDKQAFVIKFGLGLVAYPKDGNHPDSLMKQADKQMYQDKDKQKRQTK